MAQQPSVSYHVMTQTGGLLMRKHSRWLSEKTAREVASRECVAAYCPAVYVFRATRGAGMAAGWQLVAMYTDGYPEDVTTRYYRGQAQPFVLPPPSPLDDLGEELIG